MDAMMHTIKTDKIGRFITLKTPLTIFSRILSMRGKHGKRGQVPSR